MVKMCFTFIFKIKNALLTFLCLQCFFNNKNVGRICSNRCFVSEKLINVLEIHNINSTDLGYRLSIVVWLYKQHNSWHLHACSCMGFLYIFGNNVFNSTLFNVFLFIRWRRVFILAINGFTIYGLSWMFLFSKCISTKFAVPSSFSFHHHIKWIKGNLSALDGSLIDRAFVI